MSQHGFRAEPTDADKGLTAICYRPPRGFSRADVATVLIYDDERTDEGGRIADLVASTIG